METRIIKLPQAGKPNDPIVINVSRKAGGERLDLDLLATDNESAYSTKVRQRKIEKLRDADYEGSAEEWESYLLYAFVSRTKYPLPAVLQENLEINCRILGKDHKRRLTITLQISVEGINSRRGSIELLLDENPEDIDLFKWAVKLADDRDSLQQDLAETSKRVEDAQSTITVLQKQLQDLTKIKEEHEIQMLSKFTLLLNEKKLRIRTQQRRIVENGQSVKSSSPRRPAPHSRKRKHVNVETQSEPGSESDAFDSMQVDSRIDANPDQTPDEDSDEDARTATTSEDEPDLDVQNRGGRTMTNADWPTGRNEPLSKMPAPLTATKHPDKTSAGVSSNDDDETASEDDEL